MIKEVLVVEGKMDVVAIDKAVEADCIITEGFNLKKQALKNIEFSTSIKTETGQSLQTPQTALISTRK